MADKKTNPWLIVGLIVLVFFLYKNGDLFAISLQTSPVQYTNVPIEARFTTNLTSPIIKAYFKDIELFEIMINQTTNETIPTGQTISYTRDIVNNTYVLKITNVTQEGIFKITAQQDNQTDVQVIEVRYPFVDIKYDIPSSLEKGSSAVLKVQTFTPQGVILDADSIDIDVYDPDNIKTTIILEKKTNSTFEKNFDFDKAGNYQFKVHAREQGFETKEVTVITNVTRATGIHPIVFVWSGFIFIILAWVIIYNWRRIF